MEGVRFIAGDRGSAESARLRPTCPAQRNACPRTPTLPDMPVLPTLPRFPESTMLPDSPLLPKAREGVSANAEEWIEQTDRQTPPRRSTRNETSLSSSGTCPTESFAASPRRQLVCRWRKAGFLETGIFRWDLAGYNDWSECQTARVYPRRRTARLCLISRLVKIKWLPGFLGLRIGR